MLIAAGLAPYLAVNSFIGAVSALTPFLFFLQDLSGVEPGGLFSFGRLVLALSYSRRAWICSSAVRVGTLGFLSLCFLGFGFLTFLVFSLGSGLVISKRSWKVLSSVRGWGGLRCSFYSRDGVRWPCYRGHKNSGSEATGVNLATLPAILLVAGLFIGVVTLGWGVELAIRSYRRER